MSDPEKPQMNAIAWSELTSSDPDAAITFYSELFGWTSEKAPTPEMDYTMLKAGDQTFGGVMAPPEPGIPSHWLNYVSVPDVDEAAKKAESLGGTVCMPPTDIGDMGRIAIIKDPQGAAIGLHWSDQSC
ncbi:MAG: VOC family protein [Chthoniobacterales bacterium]